MRGQSVVKLGLMLGLVLCLAIVMFGLWDEVREALGSRSGGSEVFHLSIAGSNYTVRKAASTDCFGIASVKQGPGSTLTFIGYVKNSTTHREEQRLLSFNATTKQVTNRPIVAPGPIEMNYIHVGSDGTVYIGGQFDSQYGREFYKLLPGQSIPTLVQDIKTGTASSSPSAFTAMGDSLYFPADHQTAGTEIIRYGLSSGQVSVVDQWPGPNPSYPSYLAADSARGILYCSAYLPAIGTELGWFHAGNGTTGSKKIYDGAMPGYSSPAYVAVDPSGKVWMNALKNATTQRRDLQRFDPQMNTVTTVDVPPGTVASTPQYITSNSAGQVAFSAKGSAVTGREPYIYKNGTIPGGSGGDPGRPTANAWAVTLVGDLNPGAADSSPSNFYGDPDGSWAFAADDGAHGSEPWFLSADGTAVMLADINPGSANSFPQAFTLIDGRVYFFATDAANTRDIWSYGPEDEIQVTSPDGGESWTAGSSHSITWTTTGTIADVKIEYSTDSGSSYATVISLTINTGSYTWSVPYTPSATCLIRVSDAANAAVNDVSNAVFLIIGASAVTVTSPNGGENWGVGSSHNITWTSTGWVGNVKIEYSTNGGTSYSTVVDSTANTGIFPWTVPNAPSVSCLVRISNAGNPNLSDTSDSVFTIMTAAIDKDDFVGAWLGQGVYFRNSNTGSWVLLEPSTASQIAVGDLDDDGIDDLIGIFPNDPGVWTKKSSTNTWLRIDSVTPYWIAVGDMNGDGRVDFVGAWNNGVYYRNSVTGSWVLLETSLASQIAVGDLDGDGKGDLIGIFPNDPGVWTKRSSTQTWLRLDSLSPSWIAVGDLSGDGKPDLLGTWPGSGVYYKDSTTGHWILLETSVASQVVAGDLDGDRKKDLIGVFPNDPGVWTKRSSTLTWLRLDEMTPSWIAAGRMRAAGAAVGPEMSFRAPSSAFGLQLRNNFEDLSMYGPHGRNFNYTVERNAQYGIKLDESAQRLINPGPGELGFKPIKDERASPKRDKR